MAKKEKKEKKKKKGKEEEAAAEGEEGKEAAAPEAEAPKEGAEGEAPAEGAEGEEGHKKGKKKLIFIIGGVVALLLIVGGVLMFTGGGGDDKKDGGHAKKEAKKSGDHGGGHGEEGAALEGAPTYYELPEFLVNLSAGGNRVSFLKMSVTLELKDAESVAVVDANKPRILDAFNTYLRELRPADVQGSAGIYRLRDELIARVNGTVKEGLVKDILFSEIIVQ